jgi:hypothetical protein
MRASATVAARFWLPSSRLIRLISGHTQRALERQPSGATEVRIPEPLAAQITPSRMSELPEPASTSFEEGQVIRLDDKVTGFDDNKLGRPNCVVRVVGNPLQQLYVVPRTTSGSIGTASPGGLMPGLDKPGRFLYIPRLVLPADLVGCELLGMLPEAIRGVVIGNVNWAALDLDL